MSRNDIPSEKAAGFSQRLRETVQTYLGYRGDPMDKGVTLRDLQESGIVDVANAGRNGSTASLTPGKAVTSIFRALKVDKVPPPTPTGFKVSAAITNVFIDCDAPTYEVGGGHDRSILYGTPHLSGDPLPTFVDAVPLTDFLGATYAYATTPATTYRLWLKWKSKGGVESTSPAGGTNGLEVTTGQDVSLLLTALTGKITESELYTSLGDRISLIDGGPGAAVPALPKSLVEMTAEQDALNQRVQADLNQAGSDLLDTLTTVNQIKSDVFDAGLYVDPGTGVVKIYALEDTLNQLNTVSATVDAHTASLSLKASIVYVDNAVATAVLDPGQVPIFTGLEARISTAEIDISALESSVVTKASNATVDGHGVRLTSAESDIDALQGEIVLKVDTVDYTAVTGGLDARISTAETALTAIGDVTSITQVVSQSRLSYKDAERNAEAILRDIIKGEKDVVATNVGFATAQTELTAQLTDGLEAEAAARTELSAVVAGNSAAIIDEATARATADSAEATARLALGVQVDGVTAALNTEVTVRIAGDNALASQITAMGVTVGANTAAINTEATTRANADSSLATQLTALTATVGANTSNISSEATARANADSALATNITTLGTTVGANTSAISTEASTRATQTGELYAKYTVKIDTNGYVSGFGLASTANNATPYSSFIVRSDNFAIASPSGPGISPAVPFIVQTTPTTIGGVSVPVGVYLTDGFIQNGTISNAKIANATIDDAKIASLSANKITAGSMQVGSYIQSSNYIYLTQGWQINSDGYFEAQNANIRGTLTGSVLNGGRINITDGGLGYDWGYVRSGSKWWNDGVNGFVMAKQYSTGATFLEFKSGSNRIRMSDDPGISPAGFCEIVFPNFSVDSMGNASFGGALSAASGTFAGTLTAAAVNAVNTINIAGQAVTFPMGDYNPSPVYMDTTSTTWTLLNSVLMYRTGAKAHGSFSGIYVNAASNGTHAHEVHVRVLRTYDGVVVYDGTFSSAGNWGTPFACSWEDVYSYNTYYHVESWVDYKGYAATADYFRSPSMIMLECKR